MKRFAIAALLTVSALSACTPSTVSSSPSAPAAPSAQAPASSAAPSQATPTRTAPTQAVPAAGKLTLQLVKEQVEPLFGKDPDCPKGEWVTGAAQLPAKYRPAALEFARYDCHLAVSEPVPHRVGQAVYARFADAHTAETYAEDEGGLAPSLVDGSTVVLIGAGLQSVQIRPALRALSQACVCGHVS